MVSVLLIVCGRYDCQVYSSREEADEAMRLTGASAHGEPYTLVGYEYDNEEV
jgi:hypothetical protein